ncbi:MAG: hypothetical protein R3F04_07705 [Lysobacteraceae bacterium]
MSAEPTRVQVISARLLLVAIAFVFFSVAWFVHADHNAGRVVFYGVSSCAILLFLIGAFAPNKLIWWIARVIIGG